MSDIPERRWAESEIDTLVDLPKSPKDYVLEPETPPAPVKRKLMEQDPEPLRPPTREEVEAIEDQILRMAFGKALKGIRRRTYFMIFVFGMMAGFVALGVILVVLLTRAGV